jgi:16S rRNA (adenine1518-N6/adenine1519-N6)-dimethyltransferase
MIPWPKLPHPANDESLLEEIVQAAFAQRRKTLRNNLKGIASDAELESLGIDPGWRAENVSVAQFVALANHLSARAAD